jgi:gluconolactonase
VHIEQLAGGIGAAEGPAFLPDGRFIFVEIWNSRVSVWTPEEGVQELVNVGGGPNSVLVCRDGSLIVTQNGGREREWRARDQRPPCLQRVSPEGVVEVLVTSVDGVDLRAPNDLAFGKDGRLYFTDPAGDYHPTNPPPPGYIFALNPDGTGEVVVETGPTFPNGITVEADGNVVWVESFTRAVKRYHPASGKVEELCVLADPKHIPDGLKCSTAGDFYIATVLSGGVSVVSADGNEKALLEGFGDYPTNVQFRGSTMYVTDVGDGLGTDDVYRGTISRATLDGVTGLDLFGGAID